MNTTASIESYVQELRIASNCHLFVFQVLPIMGTTVKNSCHLVCHPIIDIRYEEGEDNSNTAECNG